MEAAVFTIEFYTIKEAGTPCALALELGKGKAVAFARSERRSFKMQLLCNCLQTVS